MVNLIGTYECKADVKGRVSLSASFKKQLGVSLQDGFVIKRSVFESCLELYPISEWEVLNNQVNQLNRFKRENNAFIRKFNAGVKMVEMDVSGSCLIPKDLLAFAGITKSVVLSSAVNIIEIWDKERYEQSVDDASEDFADLAEKVMGNQNNADGNVS